MHLEDRANHLHLNEYLDIHVKKYYQNFLSLLYHWSQDQVSHPDSHPETGLHARLEFLLLWRMFRPRYLNKLYIPTVAIE